ncbi:MULTISPECIES: hypothetical protein [Nocardia]|uniref:Uncharacterized protein n=1 Tax=Nocardia sputorum TaxID=2984338 RepID=A0ABN6UEL4_9NOCA|nr:hypothetical protein [Nocardia sputorum]BDU03718.1 hypothetical protein IFM12276_67460 [Nocardia sputorum]
MITEMIPMWTSQRTLVSLRDVLQLFPPNNWRWTVEDFDGVFGRSPTGITWAQFRERVATGAVAFDWNGIQQFADGVDQMIDGRIVATDESGTTVVQLDAFDSTEYEIVIDPAWSGAAAFVAAVPGGWGLGADSGLMLLTGIGVAPAVPGNGEGP